MKFFVFSLLAICFAHAGALNFVNSQELAKDFHFKGILVGGLSALAYSPHTDTFFALSDDKGHRGRPPRIYQLKLKKKNKKYYFSFVNQVFLKNAKGQILKDIDPEGLVLSEPGKIFISTEGAQMPNLKKPPGVFLFNLKGKELSFKMAGSMFWPKNLKQLGAFGIKENKGFEALAFSPKEQGLWLASEQSLHQDDSRQSFKLKKQYIRFTHIDSKSFKMRAQYVYPMDSEQQKKGLKGQGGVTDFLYLKNRQFIVLERFYLKKKSSGKKKKQDANLVYLMLADCSGADNVFKYVSLKKAISDKALKICRKKELIDMSKLNVAVDNLEGLALGPKAGPRSRILAVVSDNNFSDLQKTQFLFFRYKK